MVRYAWAMDDRPTRTDIARWTANYTDERQGAALYEALAAVERDPDRAGMATLIWNEVGSIGLARVHARRA